MTLDDGRWSSILTLLAIKRCSAKYKVYMFYSKSLVMNDFNTFSLIKQHYANQPLKYHVMLWYFQCFNFSDVRDRMFWLSWSIPFLLMPWWHKYILDISIRYFLSLWASKSCWANSWVASNWRGHDPHVVLMQILKRYHLHASFHSVVSSCIPRGGLQLFSFNSSFSYIPDEGSTSRWKADTKGIHMDGLVQDCSNSSALAMELLQSCTKPSVLSINTLRLGQNGPHFADDVFKFIFLN